MNIGPETKRGIMEMVIVIIGLVMVWQGKDVTNLLLLATGITGMMKIGSPNP